MSESYYDTKVSVRVLDTLTGKTHVDSRASTAQWMSGGNWSCDCNRCPQDDEFEWTGEQEFKQDNGVCAGEKRFLAIEVEPLLTGFTLYDFNEDYPDELIDKFLPGVRR